MRYLQTIHSATAIPGVKYIFCSCFRYCEKARIVMMKQDPSSAVGCPDFLENNRLKNGCIPPRFDCLSDHLLEVLFISRPINRLSRWLKPVLMHCDRIFGAFRSIHTNDELCGIQS